MSAVRDVFSALDRAALEAWASPGLVAHAQAYQGQVELRIESETQSRLHVEVGGEVVELSDAGLTEAWCSCPAWGPCRHVLAAVLGCFDADASPAREVDVLEGVDLEAIRKWAGATAYVDAWRLLLAGIEVEVEVGPGQVSAKIPDLGAEVRLLAGVGLSGLIVEAAPRSKKRLGALGMLAALRTRGLVEAPAEVGAVDLSGGAGAARTPAEILAATQDILRQMLVVGLSHLSSATRERLFTASVSAHAARLVRLGKGLGGLADEVSQQLQRHASADEARLFARMAELYALASALREAGDSAPEGLVGRPRARYVDVPRLHLVGLGARLLETDTGTRGLVAVFRDMERQRWLTMADVRPVEQMPDFDPRSRYVVPDVWGDHSLRALVRAELRVESARVSDDGRLSLSSQTRAEPIGPPRPSVIDGLVQDDFQAVAAMAQAAFPLGLMPPDPAARLAVLAPKRVLPAVFDGPTQTLHWGVEDAAGVQIRVRVRHGPHAARLIRALESWTMAPDAKLLVELADASRPLTAHVVSVLTPGPEGLVVYVPSLEDPRGPRRPPTEAPVEPRAPRGLPRVREGLEAWAERGLAVAAAPLGLDARSGEAEGLQTLSRALEALDRDPSPHRLLVARYLCALTERALARS